MVGKYQVLTLLEVLKLNDTAKSVLSFDDGAYTDPTYGVTLHAGFDKKEGKYYANLVNSSPATGW